MRTRSERAKKAIILLMRLRAQRELIEEWFPGNGTPGLR